MFNLLEVFRNLGMGDKQSSYSVEECSLLPRCKTDFLLLWKMQQKLDFVSLLLDLVPVDDSQTRK